MAEFNFDASEIRKIDEFINNGFENMSADDVKLYARWCAESAAMQADIDARREQAFENAELKIKLAEAESDKAAYAFQEMYNAALNRLEAVNSSNG